MFKRVFPMLLVVATLPACASAPAPVVPAAAQAATQPAPVVAAPATGSTSVVGSVPAANAGPLYMPRNVKLAYQKGTRSADGTPGPKYWQNTAVHDIHVTVAPPSRTISATEEITYTNNSPSPLTMLVIRLYQNAHRPEALREQVYTKDFLTDGIQVEEFRLNGDEQKWVEDPKGGAVTTHQVTLPKPLAPGESVKLSFKWHYDLAKEAQKEGVVDPTTFYLAYFFPRVAILSDTNSNLGLDLDEFTYRGGRELNNDFADFTFDVTVPKNYVVWATGDLQNPDQVLQPKYAKRLKDSFTSDEAINIAQPEEVKQGFVTEQSDTVTWKWQAENVPDIAIGLSDHYVWDAGSVVVDPATGRRASVQAAYNPEAKDFKQMVEYGKSALDFGSTQYPGVPYPYSKTTIFRGGADEEYPMMVNDGSQEDPADTRFVAAHEILHSWFPFYMGINEARYPLLDEGWTTAFEYLINSRDRGAQGAADLFKAMRSSRLVTLAPGLPAIPGLALDPGVDIPMITPDDSLRGAVAGSFNAYEKPAMAYLALKDYLGNATFKKALTAFIDRWHGKHPLPWDMFNTFNDVTGQNLNWFFNNWFFSNNYPDLALQDVRKVDGGYEVQVQNLGGFAIPFDLRIIYRDGTQDTSHQTPAVWKDTPQATSVMIKSPKEVQAAVLDSGIFMEANPGDNTWGTLPPTPGPPTPAAKSS